MDKLSTTISRCGRSGCTQGFTLIELMLAIALVGILSAIAIPNFKNYRLMAQVGVAISDMKQIGQEVSLFLQDTGKLPDSLNDIGKGQFKDPWGRPYDYLRLNGGTTPGLNGKRRRDKNANPVNSDYDLYSRGPDGKTNAQFTAKDARDDIVRANDGAFYGLAEKH